ncbi:hypothetical protein IMSAGC007_02252 [Lachnospiraceae bacterium]|jgi:transcriptional regulator with XRE-family HTH domain|nr:hypothetical protein IMSAGC007_02252 [Lachnospiraceae bacterium]
MWDKSEIRLGENIKKLRKIHGETLHDLAKVVDYGNTTIKNYESGERQPDIQTLRAIATHYGKTVDELLNVDLSDLTAMNFTIENSNELVKMLEILLPFSYSETALKNADFKKGYDYCNRILDAFSKNDSIRGSILSDCFEAFGKAIEDVDENGNLKVPEAVANMVWLIFLEWTQIYDNEMINVYQSLLVPRKKDDIPFIKKFLKLRENESIELKQRKTSFIKDFDEPLAELLAMLKTDIAWVQLADYYLALQYMISMIDTGLSPEMNTTIGMHMMLSFLRQGNQYAYRMMDFLNKF